MHIKLASMQPGCLLKGTQRTAPLATIEVDPVASPLSLEPHDAGAVLAWRVALDVGKTPFVTLATAIGEVARHPGGRRVAQACNDHLEIVARRRRASVVEVDHARPINRGSRARARRA